MRSVIFFILFVASLPAQMRNDSAAYKLTAKGLTELRAYNLLEELTRIGHRLTGSPQAEAAVLWGKAAMEKLGFENVRLEKVTVPHWVRGSIETLSAGAENYRITALGGSIGTPKNGVTAEVIEVKSWDELRQLGTKVKGKIVFYNRPFDKTKFNTGSAYGAAVDQRSRGAIEAARYGAVAALVRSMTHRIDGYPHTGAMQYLDTVPKIPAAAIATEDAEKLSTSLAQGKKISVTLNMNCETLPDMVSANVVGEWRGSEKPEEIVFVGGHLDSWDKGTGAHDDGAGIVHSLEAVRLIKELGLRPKRTVRVVLFMNEENGLRGGKGYAEQNRPGEKHIAAIESDAGGFAPMGFGIEADSAQTARIAALARFLTPIWSDRIIPGHSGADIGPLYKQGVACLGLITDAQRYFDYHHSDHDTIDKVNDRELELGAIAVAIMAYLIATEGL